jgi:hypothetical protein
MTRMQRTAGLTALLCLLIGPSAWAKEVVPSGTVVKVQLLDNLNSAVSQVGDRVRAQVAPDDMSGMPTGAVLVGRVVSVQQASKSQPGMIDIRFGTLETGGNWYPISGDLSSLHQKDVATAANGRLVSKGQRNRGMQFLGYGAAGGAVLGRLLGGNLLTGALLGGAGGYFFGKRKKEHYRDVDLKQGAEFGVRLLKRVALPDNA